MAALQRTDAMCQEPTYALQQTELSVDDFVGEREERGRDGEAERLGGLEVDHQLERDRLHDGKIGSLGAFENPARIDAGLLIGEVEALTALLVEPSLKQVGMFAIYLAVLMFRPRGLFGTL